MNLVRLELGLPAHGYETDDRLKRFGMWETHTYAELRLDRAEAVKQRKADKWNFQLPKVAARPTIPQDRIYEWDGKTAG